MFSKSADIYDAIYLNTGKDYAAEARKAMEIVGQYLRSSGKALLDVACGTGLHIGHLCKHYQVEGLDIDRGMLKVARRNHPQVHFHQGDMTNFHLKRRFDVITCLFSSIGYVITIPRLRQAVQTMARHLKPGGVMLVEPWFTPEQWHSGSLHAVFIDQPGLKIARMNISTDRERVSSWDFHYLVGTEKEVRHFTEHHELGLFTHAEYLESFQLAGLGVRHDPEGLDGRGLYIGSKPL